MFCWIRTGVDESDKRRTQRQQFRDNGLSIITIFGWSFEGMLVHCLLSAHLTLWWVCGEYRRGWFTPLLSTGDYYWLHLHSSHFLRPGRVTRLSALGLTFSHCHAIPAISADEMGKTEAEELNWFDCFVMSLSPVSRRGLLFRSWIHSFPQSLLETKVILVNRETIKCCLWGRRRSKEV